MSLESSPRPTFPALVRANAWVVWTWLAAVALVHAVHYGTGLGQPSLGLALSSSAIPAILVAAAPPTARSWVALVVLVPLTVLAVANALYFRLFRDYIPIALMAEVGQAWTVRGYGAGLARGGDLALPLVLLIATAAGVLVTRRRHTPELAPRWRALPLACCLMACVPALGWAWWVAPGTADMNTGGYLYAEIVDLRRALGERLTSRAPSPAELARVNAHFDQARAAADSFRFRAATPDPWRGIAAGSSVLMIQVESLNRWPLEADLGGEPILPFLRSLAARGIDFTEVYDGVHEGRSSDADYMVMASQHPLEHGAVAMSHPNLDLAALPALLGGAGYATFTALALNSGFWNAGVRYARYGFARSAFSPELGAGESFGLGLMDRPFMERSESMIVALHQPFLAWLLTLTMHGPHGPVPASFPSLPLGALEGTPVGSYLRKARYTDDAMRALVARLDSAGVMEHTTLVVYGDHTDAVGFDMDEVRRLAEVDHLPPDLAALALDRIPLLVVPPGATARSGVRIATPGTLLDVAPTILHLLGIDAPRSFVGGSLLPEGPGLAAQITGEAASGDLLWSGESCYGYGRAPRPRSDCDGLRARAREQLEVSWLVTRYDLERRLAGPPNR